MARPTIAARRAVRSLFYCFVFCSEQYNRKTLFVFYSIKNTCLAVKNKGVANYEIQRCSTHYLFVCTTRRKEFVCILEKTKVFNS
jgi:hypothetical protein